MAVSLAAGEGIEAAELAIRAGLTSLGRSVLEDLLTAGAGYRGPRTGCGAGHQAQFVSYRTKTVDTVLGPVTLNRAWYHCAACGHGRAPRDAELGIAGETMSPGLAKMAARAGAAVPFIPGAGLVGELAGIALTGKRLGRHAEADGRAAAAVIEAGAAAIAARTLVPLPPAGLPDKLYIAVDGTGVPMMTAETEDRPGKGEDGKARTREVKLACAFTQTTVDEDGYPIRDPHSSSYLATFAPAARFGTLMAAEARRRGAGHVRQLTILGDGAVWIWNLASQHFPEATQIVDLYHAREHLHDLGKLLAFMLGDQHGAWLAARLDELDAGDIPALLSAARAFPLAGDQGRRAGHRPGLLRDQRPPDALQALPLSWPVRRLRRRQGRLQSRHRPAPQTLRHALVPARRDRHPHPALPAGKRPMGRNLATAAKPARSRLTRHLTTARTQTIPGQTRLPASAPGKPVCRCPSLGWAHGYATGSPAVGRRMGTRLARA